jgi:hypothetical protein
MELGGHRHGTGHLQAIGAMRTPAQFVQERGQHRAAGRGAPRNGEQHVRQAGEEDSDRNRRMEQKDQARHRRGRHRAEQSERQRGASLIEGLPGSLQVRIDLPEEPVHRLLEIQFGGVDRLERLREEAAYPRYARGSVRSGKPGPRSVRPTPR